MYRKDRNGHGVGVCLLISSEWTSSELTFQANDTESVWCRVTLPKATTSVFGTFYRPAHGDVHSIAKFCDMLTSMPDSIHLAGDFNLRGFNFCDKTLAANGSRIHSMFADMIGKFGFEQYLKKPTRATAVLALI